MIEIDKNDNSLGSESRDAVFVTWSKRDLVHGYLKAELEGLLVANPQSI